MRPVERKIEVYEGKGWKEVGWMKMGRRSKKKMNKNGVRGRERSKYWVSERTFWDEGNGSERAKEDKWIEKKQKKGMRSKRANVSFSF